MIVDKEEIVGGNFEMNEKTVQHIVRTHKYLTEKSTAIW